MTYWKKIKKNYFEILLAKKVLGKNTLGISENTVIYNTLHTNFYTTEANIIMVSTRTKLFRKYYDIDLLRNIFFNLNIQIEMTCIF